MYYVLHQDLIRTVFQLLEYWADQESRFFDIPLRLFFDHNSSIERISVLEKAVKDADYIEDLKLTPGAASYLLDKFSKPTRFQHFAYSGAMGEILQGKKCSTVGKYGGYSWDCDPWLGLVDTLGTVSLADVKFNPDCGHFDSDFFSQSPGARLIRGRTDWDDQLYPSAIDMTEFYGRKAVELKGHKGFWDLQSLGFALHFLHDLTVPHHVLCTILNNHVRYETALTSTWFSLKPPEDDSAAYVSYMKSLSEIVESWLVKADLRSCGSFVDIGIKNVDITAEGMRSYAPRYLLPLPEEQITFGICTLAMASTIQAIKVYQSAPAEIQSIPRGEQFQKV